MGAGEVARQGQIEIDRERAEARGLETCDQP